MRAISFNDGWSYRRLGQEAPGVPVTIPHDAMLAEKRSNDFAGGINTGWYEGFDYCYEKEFVPEEALAGKCLFLEFEGVYRKAEVWLNGKQLAFRPFGYTNFYVELTGRLEYGQVNRLQVIARNADQPNSRWYSGAGIYRPVTLWEADREHILLNGVKVRTVSIRPARIEVSVRTSCPGALRAEIWDNDRLIARTEWQSGAEAARAIEIEIPDGRPWDTETHKLYTCRVFFGQDTETVVFGIRQISWGKNGFMLNGERIILKGACIHHDHAMLGACCYADAEERRVRLLKENGYNALRSAHNPCSKALLDACDRLGLLVMDEYVDHWYIHKNEYDYVEYFGAWWKQDLKDMVEKDYNHPSVIMYSIGNEVSETAQEKGIELTGEMTQYLHSLDPGRPVTCGINIFFNFLSSVGFGVYSDKKAKKEAKKAGKRGDGHQKKKAVGSQFFNELAGLLGDNTMKMGALLPPCDWKTKDAFARMDIAGYNYGIYRYRHDLKKYPDRLILGSETFCKDAYRFMELAKKHERILGDFVWAGMDYLGEVGIGSWEYRDYAPVFDGSCGWVSAGSGRIDLTGKHLGEAYYTRVALEKDPGPFLAVCPVNHTGEKHSPSAWKMSNAMDSWSWRGCEGKKANIEVYARAARVDLFLNGSKIGSRNLKNTCIAKFTCLYENGILEAAAYNQQGQETGRCALVTAGTDTRLSVRPEQEAGRAGHLSYIRLCYTDRTGIVKPLERGILKVDVTGGTLLGLGNGCPYNERSYLDSETDTYYGEALAVVKAGKAGQMKVRVTDGRYSENVDVTIYE